jgi:hypothetical protein
MKKTLVLFFVLCSCAAPLFSQEAYKQNFLSAFSKQPDIVNCEAAYNFMINKNGKRTGFDELKKTLLKAHEELAAVQLAVSSSALSSSTPAMNAENGKALEKKLKKMTKEEKMQWAMQNAQNLMPSAGGRVNKDMENQPVNEAVQYVAGQQEKDLQSKNMAVDYSSSFKSIEEKYKAKKNEALQKFQTISHTTYDPSSSLQYIFGEASDEQVARFNKAVDQYQRAVLPYYNNEMKEKISTVLKGEKDVVSTYTLVEEKVAWTHYGDDAQEPVNKQHLILAHSNVLQKVQMNIDIFSTILSDYADQYAALMKIKSVQEANTKTN